MLYGSRTLPDSRDSGDAAVAVEHRAHPAARYSTFVFTVATVLSFACSR